MAKRANANQKLSKAVSRLSADLQRYHEIGVEAWDAAKKEDIRRLRGLPQKCGVKRDHVLKARRFVEYLGDIASLKQLARPRQKQQTPLGWGHVRFFISVPDRVRRSQTLRDAVNGSWSKDQLKQAIQLQEGRTSRRKAGGRRHTSDTALADGIETHSIEGIQVRVYCSERSIADCFKFRHKIGFDVARVGLRLYRKRRRPKLSLILEYASVCRVEKIIRLYLEASE